MQVDINALFNAAGSPLVASTTNDMTDHAKVYVYTGNETGYTAGHWYYWNSAATPAVWADGGLYNSEGFVTDKTLSLPDAAADAKATGEALGELKSALMSSEHILADSSFAEDIFGVGDIDNNKHHDSTLRTFRCSTLEPIYFAYDVTIKAMNGYRVYVYKYTNGSWLGVGWQSSGTEYVMATGAQYHLVIAKTTENTSETADVSTMVSKIELENKIANNVINVKKKATTYCYFSDNSFPTFSRTLNNSGAVSALSITFPNAYFRIYYGDGGKIIDTGTYANTTFTLGILEKLVYDISNNTISVIPSSQANTEGNYILLLSVGGGVSGILAPYYFQFYVTDFRTIWHYYETKKRYWLSAVSRSDFKCLFFSDVHGSTTNVQRIIDFANLLGTAHLDAVINGGDTVTSYLENGVTWYDDIIATSNINVLNCCGNHDEYSNAYNNPADKKDVYDAIIAPVVSSVSGIEQPAGASTNGYCYYYKDYDDVRVIVIDANTGTINGFDTTQENWFKSVLADAITNSKSVLVVSHSPFNKYDTHIVRPNTLNWNSWVPFSITDAQYTDYKAFDAVDEFIDNGGEFICWLTGHTHFDSIMTNTSYPGQLMISIATARASLHNIDGVSSAYVTTDSGIYDCFDVIGVDTTNKLLKICRIGYNIDSGMKERNIFCYNYEAMDIVFTG